MATPIVIAGVGLGSATATAGPTSAIDTTGATKLALVVISQGSGTPTVSDSKTNTWAQDGSTFTGPSGSFLSFWRSTTANVGTGHTFTAVGTTAASIFVVAIGPSAGGTVTLTAWDTNSDASTPYASNSISQSSDALLISFGATDGSGNPVSYVWANSFTAISGVVVTDSNNFWTGDLAQRSVAAGTYNSQFTNTAVAPLSATLGIFQATETGGGGGTTPLMGQACL